MVDKLSLEWVVDVEMVDKFTKPFKDLVRNVKSGIGLNTKQIEGISKTKKHVKEFNKETARSIALNKANAASLKNLFGGAMSKAESKAETRRGRLGQNMLGGKANDLVENATRVNALSNKVNTFGKVMDMPMEKWQAFNKAGGEFNGRGAKMANNMRRLTHGIRGFRMEMLGVMFFGMGMKNLFTGMLRPALEMVGLLDLWRTTMQMLFLPFAMMLMDFLMPIMMWMMNLSDKTKKAIGWFVLFGAGLGLLLFLIGTLALGLGSIIMVFSGLFNIIDKIIPDISAFGFNISSIVEAGLGIGIISTLFKSLGKFAAIAVGAMLGSEAVSGVLDNVGIAIGENETIWEALKKKVKIVLDNIKTELGLETQFDSIEKWIESVKLKGTEWLQEMRSELGLTDGEIGDLSTTFSEMATSLSEATPALETFATALVTIAKGYNKIKSGLKSAANWWTNTIGSMDPKAFNFFTMSMGIDEGLRNSFSGRGNSSNQTITVAPTYNISSLTSTEEMIRLINESAKQQVDEIRRIIKV